LTAIRENGYFRADLGFFFVEDGRIDVYDGGLDSGIIWDNVLGKYELLREAEKQLPRGGAPYYHEVYQLEHGEWSRTERNFTKDPERYLDFGPCDARNQIDLPDEPLAALDYKMRRVLPPGSKIKAASQFNEQFVSVVYSMLPKEEPSIYMTGTYPLYVALLVPRGQNWQIVDTRKAEDWANFCGTRIIPTKVADEANATVLLVYMSAPQGSRILSVSRSIRSFIISRRANGPRN